mmetsp:Transcript_104606/g.296008  ORF Transcript_104606/g.296008 Transcript_104606/m.296008 type:complete len:244 (+) Transcript_104606:1002-1733(+)
MKFLTPQRDNAELVVAADHVVVVDLELYRVARLVALDHGLLVPHGVHAPVDDLGLELGLGLPLELADAVRVRLAPEVCSPQPLGPVDADDALRLAVSQRGGRHQGDLHRQHGRVVPRVCEGQFPLETVAREKHAGPDLDPAEEVGRPDPVVVVDRELDHLLGAPALDGPLVVPRGLQRLRDVRRLDPRVRAPHQLACGVWIRLAAEVCRSQASGPDYLDGEVRPLRHGRGIRGARLGRWGESN